MEPTKQRARTSVWTRLGARWVTLVPALILIFFAASAAISPHTTGAVDEPSDPIVAPPLPTDVSSFPTASGITAVQSTVPIPFAGSLTGVGGPAQPTATTVPVPTATVAPSATAAPAATTAPSVTTVPSTAIPATSAPKGPTGTPNQGEAGNAKPVDGTIRVPVLMYHYIRVNPVASDRVGYGLSVTPADFAAQMEWIVRNGYHAVFPSELMSAMTQGAPLPTKPIVLTFDDGYRDFYDQAWPMLKQYGLKSANGVVTTFADKGDRGDTQYMTWNMVQELDQSGMVEIASHTLSHSDLTKMSVVQRWSELSRSKEVIEGKLGHACATVIYPSGRYDGATVADAKRAGYQIAFTTNDGKVRAPQDTGVILQLPRVRVAGGTTLAGFTKNLG